MVCAGNVLQLLKFYAKMAISFVNETMLTPMYKKPSL